MISLVPFAVAALIATAAPALDTVFLRNGGRVRGTVVEEDPARGITLQLPSGEFRKLLPADVARVEYGDAGAPAEAETRPGGAVEPASPRELAAPAEPAPPPSSGPANDSPLPPAATPPPSALPPTRPPATIADPVSAGSGPYAPPAILTFAVSLFSMGASGEAEGGVAMSDFTSSMGGVGFEAGLRLDERLTLGAYLDLAGGEAGPMLEAWCAIRDLRCSTADLKLGLLMRYAFSPSDWQTPWVGVGVGVDVVMAAPDDLNATAPSYVGYEPIRLSAGWDYRDLGPIGVGVFATLSWWRYSSVDDGTGATFEIDDRRGHAWAQVGLRGILFP